MAPRHNQPLNDRRLSENFGKKDLDTMESTGHKAAQPPAAPQSSAAPTVNVAMGLTEWLLIIVLAIIWGGSFFFIKIAVHEVLPLTLVLFRVGFAAIALLLFGCLTGRRLPASRPLWVAFLIMGALNNMLPFSLITGVSSIFRAAWHRS
jgi:hypothetical protein